MASDVHVHNRLLHLPSFLVTSLSRHTLSLQLYFSTVHWNLLYMRLPTVIKTYLLSFYYLKTLAHSLLS